MIFPPLIAQALPPGTAPAPEDLRPLRGAIEIPEPAPLWPYFVAAAAVVALIALVWWLRSRKPVGPSGPGAADIALGALADVRREIAPGQSRTFAYAVSDILRRYLDQRFGLRAPRQTTEEFLAAAASDPASPLGAQRELLTDFLAHCDRGKFARWELDPAGMDALCSAAVRFVTESPTAPTPS